MQKYQKTSGLKHFPVMLCFLGKKNPIGAFLRRYCVRVVRDFPLGGSYGLGLHFSGL